MEIGKLFAAIGTSIQQAQEFLSQKDVERYMRYFQSTDEDASSDENGEAALYPKAIRFSLQGKEKNSYVDVPLAVMTSHETIGLKQVKVTISGNIYEDAQTQTLRMQSDTLASNSTKAQNGTVELVFESAPQSEGQARATQKMLDHIEF